MTEREENNRTPDTKRAENNRTLDIVLAVIATISPLVIELLAGRDNPCNSRLVIVIMGAGFLVALVIFRKTLRPFLIVSLIVSVLVCIVLVFWQPYCNLDAVVLMNDDHPIVGRDIAIAGGETIFINAQDFCRNSPAELDCTWIYFGDGGIQRESECSIEIKTGSDDAPDMLTVITNQKCCTKKTGQIIEALVIIPRSE